MKLLRDAAARLISGAGMILFMAGAALVALGFAMRPLEDLGELPECSFTRQPVSPVEKKVEN